MNDFFLSDVVVCEGIIGEYWLIKMMFNDEKPVRTATKDEKARHENRLVR